MTPRSDAGLAMTGPAPAAIVFDCNGVLVDDEPLHFAAFAALCSEQGRILTHPAYLDQCAGRSDITGIGNLVRTGFLTGTVLDLAARKQALYRRHQPDGPAIVVGGYETLSQLLKLRVDCYIVTANDRPWLEALLVQAGLDSIIDRAKCQAELEGAERRAWLDEIASHYGAEQTVVVDDSTSTIEYCASRGMVAILVTANPSAHQRAVSNVTEVLAVLGLN